MREQHRFHRTDYGAGWYYDTVPIHQHRRWRRGFTYRQSPKRFLILATIFIIGMANLIATVGFGIEY